MYPRLVCLKQAFLLCIYKLIISFYRNVSTQSMLFYAPPRSSDSRRKQICTYIYRVRERKSNAQIYDLSNVSHIYA